MTFINNLELPIKIYRLLTEMMEQGEFECLSKNPAKDHAALVQWWCRKTDKTYESKASELLEALMDILEQARNDNDPWVTEEQCNETAKELNIQIYIPELK